VDAGPKIDTPVVDTAVDTPMFGACTNMPSQGIPCTGMLMNAVTGSFTCAPIFAQFNSGMNQTSFLLDQQIITPPPGVMSITIGLLAMTGMPAVGVVPLVAGDRIDVMANGAFNATVPSPGTITLNLSAAIARTGGTPGDFCLHGRLEATLQGPQANTIAMTVDF
jgi:hypothetical protein